MNANESPEKRPLPFRIDIAYLDFTPAVGCSARVKTT